MAVDVCGSARAGGPDQYCRRDTPPRHAQTERAFQKQFGVTGGFKSKEKKAPGKSGHRYYKSVGLNFKTPREAIEGARSRAARLRGAAH